MNFARCYRFVSSDVCTSCVIWCAVIVLLAVNFPLFLSSPLNGDAIYYDLQAQCIATGGVLYRDMLETNLPGAVWTHSMVRAIGGESSFALRAFDFVVFTLIVWMLARWVLQVAVVKRDESPDVQQDPQILPSTFVLACFLFYLPLSPWSQTQRDLWMLLPAVVALYLRATVVRSIQTEVYRHVTAFSILEGICWGAAFWMKPHIALPAIVVILASTMLTGWSRRVVASICSIILGGLLIGAVGSGWLIASGAWPHFWDTQLHWNTEYLEARKHWTFVERGQELLTGFTPWSWLHLLALPLAVWIFVSRFSREVAFAVGDLAKDPSTTGSFSRSTNGRLTRTRSENRRVLLAALYVGWMLQIILLQHTFAYIQVPAVLLAIAVVASCPIPVKSLPLQRAIPAAFIALAFLTSDAINFERMQCWGDCVARPATSPDAAISLRPKLDARPDELWKEYPAVVEFLRSQNVSNTDVFVYHWSQLSLYSDLNLTPPHRYVITDSHEALFPKQANRIQEAIAQSSFRFVVTDLGSLGITTEQADKLVNSGNLPMQLSDAVSNRFPFTLPIVFRSGTLCVHERTYADTNAQIVNTRKAMPAPAGRARVVKLSIDAIIDEQISLARLSFV